MEEAVQTSPFKAREGQQHASLGPVAQTNPRLAKHGPEGKEDAAQHKMAEAGRQAASEREEVGELEGHRELVEDLHGAEEIRA